MVFDADVVPHVHNRYCVELMATRLICWECNSDFQKAGYSVDEEGEELGRWHSAVRLLAKFQQRALDLRPACLAMQSPQSTNQQFYGCKDCLIGLTP